MISDEIRKYCHKYNIPIDYLFQILEDQKVTPMIRGKAMEYNAFLKLQSILSKNEWTITKLNISGQPGIRDEDISIRHRRTGIELVVESKSSVRGSMKTGKGRTKIKQLHYRVKCHRSRSNITLSGTTNDKYSVDSFDLLITNPENAIYQKGTIGADLELLHNESVPNELLNHYGLNSVEHLIDTCRNDWRICDPHEIAKDGFVPRTPAVLLSDDPYWKKLSEVGEILLSIVLRKKNEKLQSKKRN